MWLSEVICQMLLEATFFYLELILVIGSGLGLAARMLNKTSNYKYTLTTEQF